MIASAVVAAADNDIIGRDGDLPWHLPADLRRFRRLTTGHVVVMGRLTHESIVDRLGHPLADRTSIVVSRMASEFADNLARRCTGETEERARGLSRNQVIGEDIGDEG